MLNKESGDGEVTTSKSEMITEIKQKLLTDENKKKAKRGFMIVIIIFGILLLIDVISMIVYFGLYGLPQ